MPELPEMEHYRRMLAERIAGRVIADTEVEREKSLNVSAALFDAVVRGRRVRSVERRAKHLLFRLDGTDAPVLVLHLMLGGWLFYGTQAERPDRTVQVRLGFGEASLHFIGLRLGYLHLMSAAEAEAGLAKLGPEPLDAYFTPERLAAVCLRKRGMLKTVLTDQSVLSGIGNCYSDEICFEAGLLPTRRTGSLADPDWRALYAAMQAVLREALQYGGYMEQPFFAGDRITGGYNGRLRVYDRAGEPCRRCGGPIARSEPAGRKSFYCPRCQR
jgi:formamidopyrimidine-DNA glycosylase